MLQDLSGSQTWPRRFAAACLLLFSCMLVLLLAPVRGNDLYNAYFRFLIVALSAVWFYRTGIPRCADQRLLLAYLIWLLISRWLNRDFYLFIDYNILFNPLFCFLLLASVQAMDAPHRERLLAWFTVIYCGFFLPFLCAGLFVSITNTYIYIPPENIWITVLPGSVHGLNLLSTSRLLTATRLYLAWGLLGYWFFRAKRRPLRLLIALIMLIFHIGMALCFSRTIQITFAVTCGMLLLQFGYRRLQTQLAAVRLGSAAALLILGFVIGFGSFNVCTSAVGRIYEHTAPVFASRYSQWENPPDPSIFGIALSDEEEISLLNEMAEKAAEEEGRAPDPPVAASAANADTDRFDDPRSLKGNFTLTGRTAIWMSVFPCIREQPGIFFYGQSSKNMMELPNKYIPSKQYKPTMHNMLLQTLMLTGFPGFALHLAWTILMIVQIIRLYFDRGRKIPFPVVFLTVILSGAILFNLSESLLLSTTDISSCLVFLLAGLAAAEYRERFGKNAAADADK